MPTKLIAGGIISLLALFILNFCWYNVQSGYVGVETTFGAVDKGILDPGLHFVIPFVSSINQISLQPQTSITQESAATHDQQNVATKFAVTYQIAAKDAASFYKNYRTIGELQRVIISATVSNDVKAIISKYNAQELITKRDLVDGEIKSKILTDLSAYDIYVDAVNIIDLEFSKAYDQAIEDKQIAQQSAEKAKYDLQMAQVNSQQRVVTAKARAEAAIDIARGHAESTIIQARADAEAYKTKSLSLTPEILQLQIINRWNGRLPHYLGSGAPLPFLNETAPPVAKK